MKIDIKGVIVPNDDKWIYDYLLYDSVCPKEVNDCIEKAQGQPIDVYINSDGGEVYAGAEIYSALRDYNGEVNIHVVGRAHSSASMILCAAKSDITPPGVIMLHNASASCISGDYHNMEKASQILKKMNEAIVAAYQEKTGKSKDELLAIMDRETWLNAEDAVELGIVDSITQPKHQFTAAYGTPLIPRNTIEKLKKELKSPLVDQAGFSLQDQAKAKLRLLKLGGKNG